MEYQQYVTEANKLLVYINPQEIKLPLPASCGDISTLSKKEQEDVYQKVYEELYKPLLLFNTETYDPLKKRDTESWEIVFGTVNKFLAMTDEDTKKQICMTFIYMHTVLNNMTSLNINASIEQLGSALDELDKNTQLCTQLENFAEANMSFPDLSDVGNRPQDTEKMTFRKEHYLQLTAIAILCKTLAPIFGQFFWQYKKNTLVDNSIKEIYCSIILTKLFERRYKPLILKLNHFIGNILIQQYKQKDDIISAYSGNTLDSQALNGTSSIFTRKFISVNLYKPNGNLMIYITTCLKNSVETQYRTASAKTSIKERDAKLTETTSDEGNASRLENESFSSKKTADVPMIVEWMIEKEVQKWLDSSPELSDTYQQAMAYYRNHLPPMTSISNYLLCTYFGTDIGGALGISMISALSYAKLAVILQQKLISMGDKFRNLAHAIMITPLNRVKGTLTKTDNKVRMTWGNTYAYRNFKQRFPYGVGDKECDGELKKIVEFLTIRVSTYNTAPVFWEIMGEENLNGQEYQCSDNIMESICDFINITVQEYDNQ